MDKRVAKEKTVPIPVVGATGEQPLCNMLFGKLDDAFNVTLNATILC